MRRVPRATGWASRPARTVAAGAPARHGLLSWPLSSSLIWLAPKPHVLGVALRFACHPAGRLPRLRLDCPPPPPGRLPAPAAPPPLGEFLGRVSTKSAIASSESSVVRVTSNVGSLPRLAAGLEPTVTNPSSSLPM